MLCRMNNFHMPPADTMRHMAAMDEARRQTQKLESMEALWQAQAEETARNAVREEQQQRFNRKMAWAALIIAVGSAVVPFIIFWLEQIVRAPGS